MSKTTLTVVPTLYDFRNFKDPTILFEREIKTLRLQQIKSFDVPAYIVGDRYQDELGEVTDFEHDNAWLLRAEIVPFTVELITANLTEIIGVITELSAHPADFDPTTDTYRCVTCKGKNKHTVTEHYIPPMVKHTTGKFARLRIMS